jgi:PKD repeat protein
LLDVTVPAPRQGGTSYAHDMVRQLPYDAYHVYADDAFAASGTGPKQGGIVIELSYRLASQLYADFDAQPREGGSPLQVQFRDLSWTPGTASIAKWEWGLRRR